MFVTGLMKGAVSQPLGMAHGGDRQNATQNKQSENWQGIPGTICWILSEYPPFNLNQYFSYIKLC